MGLKIDSIECFLLLGVEIMKPHEDENKKLVDKVGDYLKSDSYLYALLIGPQPSHGVDANIAGPHSGIQC